ncbi:MULTISPECIES: multicopper oxidase family protein [unclassified Microbacterium]|uniref:multicopper oxidase family protein n=1 Tax=unclassified Microbacterium TaxID=2609290 RepID=UPI00214CC640|nr:MULTISPECIES: multicopper oxidase family protein [unclassified Microbacterium]MCR2808172.1 multicopper oxidase family protein [Microbacterium sp. zg.B185]WIM19363.1 multicopper oxidase family protein [Microbacterium sp. zg-B185]
MTATATQLIALALGLAGAVGWGAVATSAAPVRRVSWWGVAALAAVATLAASAMVGLLWARHWEFAADRVLTSAPLSVAALVSFGASAAQDLRAGRPASTSTRVAAWAGVFAASAGVFVPFVLGAPLSVWSVAAVLVAVVGATAIAALVLAKTRARRPLGTVAAVAGAVVVIATGLALAADAAPGPLSAAHGHDSGVAQGIPGGGPTVSVVELREGSAREPDVAVTLQAQQSRIHLPSGAELTAWTYGDLGGPALEATVGDLVEVTLENRDIAEGVTVHWHGYPVANGEDGVAGVTQDSVAPGDSFTYRFTATQPGTYWYHTHQKSSVGVVRGLYGTLVVHPAGTVRSGVDVTIPLHTFAGRLVMGQTDQRMLRTVAPGTDVRLRLINTDQLTHVVTVTGTPLRVLAIDGTDLSEPGELDDVTLRIPAGGRYDVGFSMPDTGVRVTDAASRSAAVALVSRAGQDPPEAAAAGPAFDPVAYGRGELPAWAAEPFDVRRTMVLDRLPRVTMDGPAYAYTVDGRVYPHIAPTVVSEGDTVEVTIVNRGLEVHPMHPHGHRVLVLEVDGRAPAAPLWLDSFDVGPGQVWRVALVADNPGIWMDHCHNLEHAALGMVTHLAYRGVVSPFEHGGTPGNDAE